MKYALTVVILASVGFGCSDDVTFTFGQLGDVADADGTRDVATDGDGSETGGETGDDDASDTVVADTANDTPAVHLVGGVTVFETRAPGIDQLVTGGVAAGFGPPPTAEGAPVAEIGPCVVRPTSESSAIFEGGPTADAGEIRVFASGAQYTLRVVETEGGPRYRGDVPDDQSEFFDAGATVTVEAVGGADVGEFIATVLAPEEPVIFEPEWSLGDSHSRDEALNVRWTGSPGSAAVLNITPVDVLSGSVADGNGITCALDDTGSFQVSAEALSWLPEGGMFGGTTVALTVARLVNSGPQAATGATATLNVTASHTIVGSID